MGPEAGGSIVGGAGVAALVFLIMKLGDWWFDKKRAMRADTEAGWKTLIDQYGTQLKEQGEKIAEMEASHKLDAEAARKREVECNERVTKAEKLVERAIEHIGHIEDILLTKNIRFKKFRAEPSGDTDKHPPLPHNKGDRQ